jgi:hypothetical protein
VACMAIEFAFARREASAVTPVPLAPGGDSRA